MLADQVTPLRSVVLLYCSMSEFGQLMDEITSFHDHPWWGWPASNGEYINFQKGDWKPSGGQWQLAAWPDARAAGILACHPPEKGRTSLL